MADFDDLGFVGDDDDEGQAPAVDDLGFVPDPAPVVTPESEGPGYLDQAEAFLANTANAATLHQLPAATGYAHAGADWAQSKVGPGMISNAIQWAQERSLGDRAAELEGAGQQAYEDERRGYFDRLRSEAPLASGAGEVTGTVLGAVATPGLAPIKGLGMAKNAARMVGNVGIDTAMSGVDQYGQTGDVGQALDAARTGGELSAGLGVGGRALGMGARGLGWAAEKAGKMGQAVGTAAKAGARVLNVGADMSRTADTAPGLQHARQSIDDMFDQLRDPELLSLRANEANAAAAGMRLQTHRRKINQLPGPIEGFEGGGLETVSQQVARADELLPKISDEGEERVVYGLDDARVLKVARQGKPRQNRNELALYRAMPEAQQAMMPRIEAAAPDGSWIVAEKVRPFEKFEDFDEAFGPNQLDAVGESLYEGVMDPRLTPQMAEAVNNIRPIIDQYGAARGELLSIQNMGIGADGKLKLLDVGELRGNAPKEFVREVPDDLVIGGDTPRVVRGTGGVQGYGSDLERLGLTLPNLPATQKRAEQVMDQSGKMRGSVIKQVDGEIDRNLVTDALLTRADEVSGLIGEGDMVNRLKKSAEDIQGMGGLTADKLWKSIQANRDKVNRNSPPADIEYYGELEDAMNSALDAHVFRTAGPETFEAWKRSGRDYQVAKMADMQAQDMIERGMTNRTVSLTNTIALAGGMAAGGPLGLPVGLAAMAGNQLIRQREKPWAAQFFRYARDRARAGEPLAEEEIEAARQATHSMAGYAEQLPGALAGAADVGASALRGIGTVSNVAGRGMEGLGMGLSATGRGLRTAAGPAGRGGLFVDQEPLTPEERQAQRVRPRDNSMEDQIRLLQELQAEDPDDDDLYLKYNQRLQQRLLENPKARQQFMGGQ